VSEWVGYLGSGGCHGIQCVAGPVPAVSPSTSPRDSLATAEVAVRARYIDALNGGCDTCGGGVLTRLVPVVWKRQGGLDGTVGGVPFAAAFAAGSGWQVQLNSC
jgi:hypothetical protein